MRPARAGAGVAVKRWPHTVPLEECSEVYRRYRDTPGIRAAFVKDMAIEDTIRFDMAILEARDSATFVWLLKELGDEPEQIQVQMEHARTDDNPYFTGRYKEEDLSCTLPARHTTAIIHPHRPQDRLTLIYRSLLKKIPMQ